MNFGAPNEVKDLPATFTGYHSKQIVNLKDERLIPGLIEKCRAGGADGGWAAHTLGILKCKEAIPDLVKLGRDANSFAQYSAGRALFECGAKKEAADIFERLMAQVFEPRDREYSDGGYRKGEVDPYYVALAARAHLMIDAKSREKGLKRLVTLLGELEPSLDVNDQSRIESARHMLAVVTDEYFVTHKEAAAWLAKQFKREKN